MGGVRDFVGAGLLGMATVWWVLTTPARLAGRIASAAAGRALDAALQAFATAVGVSIALAGAVLQACAEATNKTRDCSARAAVHHTTAQEHAAAAAADTPPGFVPETPDRKASRPLLSTPTPTPTKPMYCAPQTPENAGAA